MARRRPFPPARGSRTGRPLMVLLDQLGRRWSLRILWELRDGALSFRALRERCNAVSPSVLAARLAELGTLGLVETTPDGYALTAEGRSLGALLLPIARWAESWATGLGGRDKLRPAR